MPHELTNRQIERHQNKCQFWLSNKDESSFSIVFLRAMKMNIFENPKRRSSWVHLNHPLTSSFSPIRLEQKAMLYIRWDLQSIVYYKLLNPGKTVTF